MRVEALHNQPVSPRPSQLQQLTNRLPPYTQMNTDILMKMIMVGDTGVGKSSFLRTLLESSKSYPSSTIGVDMITKYAMVYPEELLVKTTIWDTAGQESFRSIISTYYRTVCGGFYVFDVSQPDTLHNLKEWIETSRTILHPSTHSSFIILATKTDVPKYQRMVSTEDGKLFAEHYGLPYIECSSRKKTNIEYAYTELVRHVLNTHSPSNPQPATGIRYLIRDVPHDDDADNPSQMFERCCNVM